ncbi:hypothetical protein VitviT2T_008781 [Vitis vinifera]|uniref:Uncharacterized protein n=1 Tax=Vitis vinifera TaxID=29760 RepID=A0ABY9C3K4_VITVI|nr:hypothetical protein VitviT2T_008781 [Vitis vinifera]
MEAMRRLLCSNCHKELELTSQEALEGRMEIDQPTETRTLNLFGEGDVAKHKAPRRRSRKIIPSAPASGNHKRLHVEREREEILPPRVPKRASCSNVIRQTLVLNHSPGNSTPASSYPCPSQPSTRWIRTGEGDWILDPPHCVSALSPTSLSLSLGQVNEYKNQVSECSTQPPKRQRIDPSQFGDPMKILDERRGFMWMDGGLSSGNHPENAFLEHGETTIGGNNTNESSTSSKRVDDKVRNKTKKVTEKVPKKVPKKVTNEVEGENGASKRHNGNANNTTFLISLDRSNILENASQEASFGQSNTSSGARAADFDLNQPYVEEY